MSTEYEPVIRSKYRTLLPTMNERNRRWWSAMDAVAWGRGGIAVVMRATGLAFNTIAKGIRELGQKMTLPPDRVRRPGGGRKKATLLHPALGQMLDRLVEPATRGDPESPLRWTCKSTRRLAAEVTTHGYAVSHTLVATLLAEQGYSLQANQQTKEGTRHPARNAQFEHSNRNVITQLRRHQPVISVDTKKKELVGPFKHGGREWQPQGQPVRVKVHNFVDPRQGKVIPYGVYDLGRNVGWVSVGVEPAGRVWWGIESGIMAKLDQDFFATDVSRGFFDHYVTMIRGCADGTVWVASSELDRPIIGYAKHAGALPMALLPPRFQTEVVTDATGAVTALACGLEPGTVYVGTSAGAIVGLAKDRVLLDRRLDNAVHITSLAVDRERRTLWVGTEQQGLVRYDLDGKAEQRFDHAGDLPTNRVTALAIDAQGAVWAAFDGHGLARYQQAWTVYEPSPSGVAYGTIGFVEPDPVRGVWYLAGGVVRSQGVGYVDGTVSQLFNPPHRILDKPTGLAVDGQGHVWVGTAFDGLYGLDVSETPR